MCSMDRETINVAYRCSSPTAVVGAAVSHCLTVSNGQPLAFRQLCVTFKNQDLRNSPHEDKFSKIVKQQTVIKLSIIQTSRWKKL